MDQEDVPEVDSINNDLEIRTFLEILSGVIRGGPGCDSYGKPYKLAVAISSVDGKTAVIKALVSDEKKLTKEYVRSMVETLKKAGFEEVHWERIK